MADREMPLNEIFRDPPAQYRGAPFWAWNCRMDRETARQHIAYFAQMGFGGFHIHSRTGMETPYLQAEYMELVRFCAEEAEKQGLKAMLYDEDRWPSGAAGGLVTRDPRFRERRLVMTPENRQDDLRKEEALKKGAPYYIASFSIVLREDGTLEKYARVPRDTVGENIRHAFSLSGEESPWFNDQAYLDTLSESASDAFVRETHERYAAAVGDYFGGVIPSMFTDEPRPAFRRRFAHAAGRETAETSWTADLPETFEKAYGFSLVDTLPEVFWDLPDGGISRTRYCYHDHVSNRFVSAFLTRCSDWCEANGLIYTGHMLGEDSLFTQTSAAGDVMRCYPVFSLPGIDMLCDAVHLNTAKQAQSVSRQLGRNGVLSELYGVTNWDFDFRGHKFQGDWQAALGVTLRVPHLSWTSMEGEAKRDYPASISYQSPWYREYRWMEDHFARLNTVLTRGEPLVSVGVIHPIESYWCRWGPEDTAFSALQEKESRFHSLTEWLLRSQVDFDFICEATLPDMGTVEGTALRVGKMAYDTVIVPGCETLRQTTLLQLQAFKKAGGRLIFLGDPPAFVDAAPSEEGVALCRDAEQLPFSELAVREALENKRFCTLREASGAHCSFYVGQMRREGDTRWLFLAPREKPTCPDVAPAACRSLTLCGHWQAVLYDTQTGETRSLAAVHPTPDTTRLDLTVYPQDSLLLRLDPTSDTHECRQEDREYTKETKTLRFETVHFERAEPNVLLLDQAEWALDEEALSDAEEILRLDNQVRERLGYPLRTNKFAQPWTAPVDPPTHVVTLAYTVHSACRLTGLTLALERAEECEILWNGEVIPSVVTGWYVDRAIRTVALPPTNEGENRLVLRYPYGRRSGLEAVYLLGAFDVSLAGAKAVLHPPRDTVGFSSITGQGMPFYGGNLTYHLPVEVPEGCTQLRVRASSYRGALVGVSLDGEPVGRIVTAPYECVLTQVSAGAHTLSLTLFGNRYNTFGALHNRDTTDNWYGFMYWRSVGDAWSYEYNPKETGILASPVVTLEFLKNTQVSENEITNREVGE